MEKNNNILPPRRRTEKACDQCRRRKTKCNGARNCSRCADFGFKCTFGGEAGRVRSPAYVAHLEQTVKDLEERLESSSNSPTQSPSPGASRSPPNSRSLSRENSSCAGTGSSATTPRSLSRENSSRSATEYSATSPSDTHPECLNTMCYPPGHGIPKFNHSYLYGSCSGIEILRRMRVSIDAGVGLHSSSTPAMSALTDALDRSVPDVFDSPTTAFRVFSPQKESLRRSVNVAFAEGFWFGPFLDRNFVDAAVERVYGTSSISVSTYSRNAEMALVYAIAAIGECLDRSPALPASTMDELGWRGVAYFRTVQSLIDPMQCESSLLALQTVTCLALYLITVSATSRAHMFVGMAATAAMRMGLHLPSTGSNVPYHERLTRKRTYRCIMAMDIYLATFLGQPCCLQGIDGYEDFVKRSDMEEDAFFNTHDESETAAAASMEVYTILRSATQESYFSGSKPGAGEIYSVPSTTISNHNAKLEAWFASLVGTNLSGPLSLQVQQTGAYAEMVINSPFLHYLTIPASLRSYDGDSSAAKCVVGAIRTIELLQTLKDFRNLNEAHSFNLRSLAFASMALLFVELCGHEIASIQVVREASTIAEDLLRGMAMQHAAALGCYESLYPLFNLKRQLAQTLPPLTPSSSTISEWSPPSPWVGHSPVTSFIT